MTTTPKPNWLQLHERAQAEAQQARVLHAAARQMRCRSEERGEQCTADFFPAHEHQYAVDEDGF
jgi:hypothetical protein